MKKRLESKQRYREEYAKDRLMTWTQRVPYITHQQYRPERCHRGADVKWGFYCLYSHGSIMIIHDTDFISDTLSADHYLHASFHTVTKAAAATIQVQ